MYFRGLKRKLPRGPNEGLLSNSRAAFWPHFDVDPTMAVLELYQKPFYILFPAKGIMSYRQIISSGLYDRSKGTSSLAGRAI